MFKADKTYKINNLFSSTSYYSKNKFKNFILNRNSDKLKINPFPPIFNSYTNIFNNNNNKLWNKNFKNNNMDRINKTFYSIKRQVHHLMPRTKSLIYKSHKNFEFKNIFHSDTFEKIRNKVYNNELNEEFNHEKGNYNMLLYNLIKKNKNSKIGEINIKYNFINKINKNLLKKKNEKQKNNTYKMLKLYKSYNYTNFKKNIGITLEKKDVIDKKIKEILDNVEAKFDNIFIDVMDKKYNLDQINQFKENNNIY